MPDARERSNIFIPKSQSLNKNTMNQIFCVLKFTFSLTLIV